MTETQSHGDKDTQTYITKTDTEEERLKETEETSQGRWTPRHTDTQTHRHTDSHTDSHTDTQTAGQPAG